MVRSRCYNILDLYLVSSTSLVVSCGSSRSLKAQGLKISKWAKINDSLISSHLMWCGIASMIRFEHTVYTFFLWCYLKEKVFKHCPHVLLELKKQTIKEINAIPWHLCNCTIQNFRKRLQLFVDADCHHLGDIFYKNHESKMEFTDYFNWRKIFSNIFGYYSSSKLLSPFCWTLYRETTQIRNFGKSQRVSKKIGSYKNT